MSEAIMERLRVYIGWTVPAGLLLRKLAYADAQAVTPFIAALVLWAAYELIDCVGTYSFGAYNQLGQQVSGKVFDPLVMDRRAPWPCHARTPPARPQRTRGHPRSCGGAHGVVRCATHCNCNAPGTSARRRSEARARRQRSAQP
jgi:hypothetical protein